jgi:membrane protease YdiL (CAAX protease family)
MTRFFLIALGICWLALAPAALAALGAIPGRPDAYMGGALLAVFSPTIAAIVSARREGGSPAVRAIFRGLRVGRAGPLWLVLALVLPGALYVVARAAYGLVAVDGGPFFYGPTRPDHFGAILFVPIFEEIGWRGYALPRLVARHGAYRATAILGVLWALWHVPMFVSIGMSAVDTGLELLLIACGNVVYTWIFRRAGGSLLAAWLLHLGAHIDNPLRMLPGSSMPLYLLLAAFLLLAIAVLVLDRRAFEGTTPHAPGTEPAVF